MEGVRNTCPITTKIRMCWSYQKKKKNPQYQFCRTSVRWNPTSGRKDTTKLRVAPRNCSAIVPNFHITQHRLTHHKKRVQRHTVFTSMVHPYSLRRSIWWQQHTSLSGGPSVTFSNNPTSLNAASLRAWILVTHIPTTHQHSSQVNSTSCPLVSIDTVLHVSRYPCLTVIMCRRKWSKAMLFLII